MLEAGGRVPRGDRATPASSRGSAITMERRLHLRRQPPRPRRPRSQSLGNDHTRIAVTEVPRRTGQPPAACSHHTVESWTPNYSRLGAAATSTSPSCATPLAVDGPARTNAAERASGRTLLPSRRPSAVAGCERWTRESPLVRRAPLAAVAPPRPRGRHRRHEGRRLRRTPGARVHAGGGQVQDFAGASWVGDTGAATVQTESVIGIGQCSAEPVSAVSR